MTERIRAALEAAKAALKACPRMVVEPIESPPDNLTINLEMLPHVSEIAQIEVALNELTMLEVGLEDLLRTPRCAACDEASRSRLEAMKPPAIDEANPTGA